MNPFTHPTVARPLVSLRRSPGVAPSVSSVACPRAGHRLARVVSAAGFAALTWSGGALALDLNTATEAQLKGVRGIGAKTAQIILEERERGGRYESFSDLSDRVKGIGPKKASALQAAGLAIGDAKAVAQPPRTSKR